MKEGVEFHEEANKFFDTVSLAETASINSMFGIETYFRSLLPKGKVYDNFAHIETIHYMLLNDKKEFIPIQREMKIKLKDAPDWCLDVGIIDRIDTVDNKNILIEYKSGKHRSGINQELSMYKVLYEYATNQKIDYVCAIYPNELYGTTLPSGIYFKKPSYEKQARDKVAYAKNLIRQEGWDKNMNECAWCGVADACFNCDEGVI